MKRKGWIITGVVVGVLLVLLLVVPYLVDADTYRPTIEAALRSSLGRQVEIGHLHFSLLSRSLTAENISIADDAAFSRSPFLRARSLKVGAEVFPLLFSHALRVSSLTIEQPQVNLLRSSSGRWNFASLGAGQKPVKAGTGKNPGSGLSEFSVQELRITDGRLSIGRAPSSGTLPAYENVDLEVKNISPASASPFTLSAKTPSGGKLKLEGTAGPIDPSSTIEHLPVHVKFNAQKLPAQDVEGLLQVLGVGLPSGSSLRSGTVNADLTADGPLGRLVTTGPLSMSNVTLSGFNMASKLGALGSLGGGQGGSDTLIQIMSSKLRLAPEGYRFDELNIVIPALGTVTGAGTISPNNSLNFRMLAKLEAGSALGGLQRMADLGQSSNGIPFRIQGTTSNPVFIPEVGGALGGQIATPTQGGLGQFLGELTGKKKSRETESAWVAETPRTRANAFVLLSAAPAPWLSSVVGRLTPVRLEHAPLADQRDEGQDRAGQAAIAPVDKPQFTPEFHVLEIYQLDLTGAHLVAGKAGTDERYAQACRDKALDHAHAGQFHADLQPGAVGTKILVQQLTRESGPGKDERMLGDFARAHGLLPRQRIPRAHHQHDAVAKNRVHLQAARLHRQRDDADVNRTVLNLLEHLVAEVAIDADLDGRIEPVILGKHSRQHVEAGGFVGSDGQHAPRSAGLVGDGAQRFVAQCKETCGVFEQRLSRRC
jgi:hypothetical protein